MQKGQALIFLLIGILILAGGAFYLGRQTSTKPSPTPVATSQTPPSSISPVAISPIPQSTPQPLPCGTPPPETYDHNPLPATAATSQEGVLVIDPLYLDLSRSADYVIHGYVRSDLGQTREVITDRLGTMAYYYNRYLIDVNKSVIALGGDPALPALPTVITIRDQITTVAPTYVVGQSFIGFLTIDPQHGTYRSGYQPLPVSECNDEVYLSGSNIRVADFMLSLKKNP